MIKGLEKARKGYITKQQISNRARAWDKSLLYHADCRRERRVVVARPFRKTDKIVSICMDVYMHPLHEAKWAWDSSRSTDYRIRSDQNDDHMSTNCKKGEAPQEDRQDA